MADEENEQSPFARPGFIVAAVVVVGLVVAGIFTGVNIATRDDGNDAEPSPSSSSSPSAVPSTESPVDGTSVCGLPGAELEGTLTTAPAVDEWLFQGTTAYPSSAQYGPAATDEGGGFKYCFQQSPEGAASAAAYALAVATDQAVVPAWLEYFAAPGPYRDDFLVQPSTGSTDTSARLRLAGFRLLSYDGQTARVDLAVVASAQNQTINGSFVYNLVWSDGDWKIDTSTPEPGDFSTIPDFNGYIAWSE